MKSVRKTKSVNGLLNEIKIMRNVNHENII